jgi:hypothetical protein
MQRLKAIDKEMLASPDQQISLTDPDSRSMATSGRGSGVVGCRVRIGATRSLMADRANHIDSSSQLRQHARLRLASPVSLGRNVFTRPRPIADALRKA